MQVWLDPAVTLPANGQTVWIRRTVWLSQPVMADFSTVTNLFTLATTGLTLDWFFVARWRSL